MRQLSSREKLLLKVMGGILAAYILFTFVISPVYSSLNGMKESSSGSVDKMNQLNSIYAEWNSAKQKKQFYDGVLKGSDNITSLVQQAAATNNLTPNLAYTRRNQSNIQNKYTKITTDVKIEGASIQSLIKFIYDLENSGTFLNIDYLNIVKGLKGTDKYDALVKINTYMQR
jgi:hypothetical protein